MLDRSKEWRVGIDPPEDHPLWEEQVLLERGMLREGANQVRDQVIKAAERRKMSTLAPVRALITEWLPIVAGGIKDWVADCTLSSGGPRPIALKYLADMDPYVVALTGLREVLDGITLERNYVATVAENIGRQLEHEAKIRLWEAEDPELFHTVQKMLVRDKATSSHQARVNLNRFNHHLAAGTFGFGWVDWGRNTRFHVGAAVVDVLLRYTSWFELTDDPAHSWKKGAAFSKAKLVLSAKEGLSSYIGKAFDHAEVTNPKYKPTLMPPKRWDGTKQGGYYTPYVNAPRLIRFKASQENQKARAQDEYEALDMPAMYSAIHVLQETPWTVNSRVLQVAKAAWAMDREMTAGFGIGKLPLISEEKLPVRTGAHEAYMAQRKVTKRLGQPDPEVSDALATEMKRWVRNAKAVRARNAKRAGRMRSTTTTIQLAEEFDGRDFYFPHMLDFRGRVYPIPAALQPQGNDLARGLLLFAGGVSITAANEGASWLALHLANCWGKDKIALDARIAWTHEQEAQWRSIASDPLEDLRWATCDKPWQALAAIFDWVGYLNDGEGYISHVPVMVDGTCNGIQHLSAIMRDEVAGKLVNLTAGLVPEDIYQEVADRLVNRIWADQGPHSDYWLGHQVDVGGRKTLSRKLTKRQTMVLPYGGTKDSCFGYTQEWMDENDPAPQDMDTAAFLLRQDRVTYLTKHLWAVLQEVVSGGMEVMAWLQKCAAVTAVGNQPIYWTTPAGFVVRHFYGKVKIQQIATKLDGQRHNINLAEFTDELDKKAQTTGVPPNFIHSLDAAALVTCVNHCKALGLDNFTAIHDAYGTHAGNMWTLARLIRESFVEVHRENPLVSFRAACLDVLSGWLEFSEKISAENARVKADGLLPVVPKVGKLDLDGVLMSDYFFA